MTVARPVCRPVRNAALAMLIVLAGACVAPPPAPPVPDGAPPDFPSAEVPDWLPGTRYYRPIPDRSTAYARVWRGGAMARLGHDHAVSVRRLSGIVAVVPQRSGSKRVVGDFYATLGELAVDDPALRATLGFDTEPSDDDRDGTRRNMLASVQADAHPWFRLTVAATLATDLTAEERELRADVRVTLAGASHDYDTVMAVSNKDGMLRGWGDLQILQSDFGIEPFSVMGGALTVRDGIDIHFDVTAASSLSIVD